jgi:hypothetical protein
LFARAIFALSYVEGKDVDEAHPSAGSDRFHHGPTSSCFHTVEPDSLFARGAIDLLGGTLSQYRRGAGITPARSREHIRARNSPLKCGRIAVTCAILHCERFALGALSLVQNQSTGEAATNCVPTANRRESARPLIARFRDAPATPPRRKERTTDGERYGKAASQIAQAPAGP